MKILYVECKYCGDISKHITFNALPDKCRRCGDKNLIIRKWVEHRIDTYVGCPPFIEDQDPYDQGWID